MISLKKNLRKLKDLSTPDVGFKVALRNRLTPQPVSQSTYKSSRRYILLFACLVLGLVLSTGSYAYAATSVTDGDILYPVKTSLEDAASHFATTPEARARFQAMITKRRLREALYQVNYQQTPSVQAIQELDRVTGSTFEDFRQLPQADITDSYHTLIKEQLRTSLIELREKVDTSNIPAAKKVEYLQILDARLERLQETR